MTLFEWTTELSIDGGSIDRDHQHLIGMANHLLSEKQVEAHEGELSTILNEIFEYVQYHFEHEEELMVSCGYPLLQEHHEKHQEILQSMIRIVSHASTMKEVVEPFRELLVHWVVVHIGQEDRNIRDFLGNPREFGVSSSIQAVN